MDQNALMMQLQQTGMTMDDLRIYLDTHPDDSFAIQRYNESAKKYHQLNQEYLQYGPLISINWQNDDKSWKWTEQPFPWDLA